MSIATSPSTSMKSRSRAICRRPASTWKPADARRAPKLHATNGAARNTWSWVCTISYCPCQSPGQVTPLPNGTPSEMPAAQRSRAKLTLRCGGVAHAPSLVSLHEPSSARASSDGRATISEASRRRPLPSASAAGTCQAAPGSSARATPALPVPADTAVCSPTANPPADAPSGAKGAAATARTTIIHGAGSESRPFHLGKRLRITAPPR